MKAVRESKGGYIFKSPIRMTKCKCGGIAILHSLKAGSYACQGKCKKLIRREICS